MDKILKTILIISIAVFGAGFLFVLPVNAQVDKLVVEYWSEIENKWLPLTGPVFNETNFLPGEDVTRLVRVTNNSGQNQGIATEAINKNDPDHLGAVLNLEIKEGGAIRYNNALSQFFNAGEVYLSDLANGATTQYDFTVTFYSGTQNTFQGKSLSFNILIGFQGEEGGLLPGAGTGVGGFLPPGLTIIEGTVTIPEGAIGETSVTITWLTSYLSTSQVIYAAKGESYSFDLTKLNYGYPHAAPVPEDSTKVTFHSVTITGLNSGTTYYYRTVSHGSLAISQEYTFTTQGVAGVAEEVVTPQLEAGGIPSGEEMIEITPAEAPVEGAIEKPEGFVPEGAVPSEGGIVTVPPEERAPGEGLASLFLASLGVIRETAWMAIIATFGLIGLVVMGIREWELARKKKKGKF